MTSATLLPPTAAPAVPSRPPTLAALQRSLPRWDFVCALLLSLVAGYLHLSLYNQHAPLWRDEVNTAQLATFPAFADTWKLLPYDSCPILFPGLVRAWAALLPAQVDWNLRLLGFLVGLGVLGALWLCVRGLGGRVPLLSVALLEFNPMFVRYGDSVRPYGLGILFVLLIILTVWRVLAVPRTGRVLLAMAVAILGVHALFYNAVLLLAVCLGGALVAARERDGKKAALVLGIGVPAALSLLPYGAMIREQHRWGFLLYYPVDAAWLWKRLSEVTGSPDPLGVWIWPLLFVGVAAWAGCRLLGKSRGTPPLEPGDRAAAFALSVLLLGTVGYGLFLKALHYYTQPWYYVTLLALAAVCLDVLYGRLVETAGAHASRWRLARLAFVVGFAGLTFLQSQQDLLTRPTNVDLIAAQVAARADRDDLIVHTRWECAITFGHYYHGPTPQETLPPLADHRLHRYDLVLQQLTTPDAVRPVLDRMAKTLREGHRIWLVGNPDFPPAGRTPQNLKPLTQTPTGWVAAGDYYRTWTMQASQLLEQHATGVEIVALPAHRPASGYENLPLSVLQGWK